MSTLPEKVFVGLDYHLNSVQVCVLDADGKPLVNASRANNVEQVASMIPADVVVQAAIEACCGAAAFAEQLIAQTGWSVHLAHAGYVSRMKQSPDKSDFSDARLLANLVRVGCLPKAWLAPLKTADQRFQIQPLIINADKH